MPNIAYRLLNYSQQFALCDGLILSLSLRCSLSKLVHVTRQLRHLPAVHPYNEGNTFTPATKMMENNRGVHLQLITEDTHTHTHTYIYIYIYNGN